MACGLSSLTVIYVDNNLLIDIPDSIGNLSRLTALYVGSNLLTHLPDTIGSLTALTHLDIDNNPITSTQTGKDEVVRRFGRKAMTIQHSTQTHRLIFF